MAQLRNGKSAEPWLPKSIGRIWSGNKKGPARSGVGRGGQALGKEHGIKIDVADLPVGMACEKPGEFLMLGMFLESPECYAAFEKADLYQVYVSAPVQVGLHPPKENAGLCAAAIFGQCFEPDKCLIAGRWRSFRFE